VTRKGRSLLVVALVGGCGSSPAPPPDAAPPPIDAAPAPSRLLLNSVNAGGAQLLFQDEFEAYVDATLQTGIHDLHVFGQLRQRCYQCAAPGPVDIDTAPAVRSYDFGEYFRRLDYAITAKRMRVVLSMNLTGRFDTDAPSPGAYNALPPYFGVEDVMTYRNSAGADVIYAGSPPVSGQTKIPRFEKPPVRALLLDYATALVTQFRARYGDAILYYSFTFNTTSENEYALIGGSFVDTSPDAAAAFRAWLATRYATPQAVSTAWGRTPAFTDFAQIGILDGQPPPLVGAAPRAYLDFMAYRETALASFLGAIRDRVHAAGGRVMAQYGSVWDSLSAMRGTYGFGRQIPGFDLVLVDDAPGYPHDFSMDFVRTNRPAGIPFGNEVDAPCLLGCTSGDLALCCDAATFPQHIDVAYGMRRMDEQVAQSYALGALYVDLANWDNFYRSAFSAFAPSLGKATTLAAGMPTAPVAVQTQSLSLLQLYMHHEDQSYLDQLVTTHASLAQGGPVAVMVDYDL